MSNPNDPERPDITFWKPLRPNLNPPLWCDGGAFQYPVDRESNAEYTNLPFTLEAYTQIVTTHRTIVPETSIPEPEAPKVWKKQDVIDLKNAIETDQYEMEWKIAKADANYWHEDEVNDLRRASAYPNLTEESPPFPPDKYDYGTGIEGFRWLYESPPDEETPSGWHSFIGQKLADSGQTHRFWMWSRVWNTGGFDKSTVGPIGVDGTVLEPFGGIPLIGSDDDWINTPQEGSEVTEGVWHLTQFVQDIEPDIEQLSTAKHPIKGTLYSGWEWNIEWGANFFQTWEYYIDTTIN